ncbi:hypothetical protein GCM10009779_04210 [Polymorphospora rubra]|uniref:Uncharacterized protein n=1 Tax=Polymorphospora rubra TaxID=338584 RepID=A0A810MPK5_9ACTN|nr:hypothetical protein Prubr_01880 [Polymorphospora rubra]
MAAPCDQAAVWLTTDTTPAVNMTVADSTATLRRSLTTFSFWGRNRGGVAGARFHRFAGVLRTGTGCRVPW